MAVFNTLVRKTLRGRRSGLKYSHSHTEWMIALSTWATLRNKVHKSTGDEDTSTTCSDLETRVWKDDYGSFTGPALIWVPGVSIPACLLKASEKILHAFFTRAHDLIPQQMTGQQFTCMHLEMFVLFLVYCDHRTCDQCCQWHVPKHLLCGDQKQGAVLNCGIK